MTRLARLLDNTHALRIIESSSDFARILDFLASMTTSYPNIEQWFLLKVVPGLNEGSRYIVIVEEKEKIVAIGIAKREDGEKKICTIRVDTEYLGRGYATLLFENMFDWLGTRTPLITVEAEKVFEFKKIFEKYKFTLTSIKYGAYRLGRAEYIYNEID
jgi:hypothetical protein